MNKLFVKAKEAFANNWILVLTNILIYIFSLYLELKYIFTYDFYHKFLSAKYGSESEFLQFLSSEKSLNLLNYLWMPVHVLSIALFTTICIFLGFNIMGIRVNFEKSFKSSLQASILLSLNYLIVTVLKISGLLTYNYDTVDDVYFFQSIGKLCIQFNWPNWAYGILERFNIAELFFYIFLSLIIAHNLKIKIEKSLLKTAISYSVGLFFLGIITTFISVII